MIEELTPQILTVSMIVIIIIAPTLTLLLSVLLLWRYRRAVTRAMGAKEGFHGSAVEGQPTESLHSGKLKVVERTVRPGSDLYQRAARTPWHNAALYAFAVLAAALVFSISAQFVYPFGSGLPGFFVGMWIYAWPAVMVLPLIVPSSMRLWIIWVIVYFVGYSLLGLWASTVINIPEVQFGEVSVPPRSSVTPFGMTRLWLNVNAAPTLLILLCFNRWVRAVAPLVLALVTIVITGGWFTVVSLFSPIGRDVFVWLESLVDVHPMWLVLATFALSLVCFGVIGWALARWISRAYRQKKLSDRSLMLDALWLVFACTYSMWLVLGGLVWIATLPAAFLAYKIVLAVGARVSGRKSISTRGLTFLRVFALGRRTEALLDAVTKYWRHIGSVQMIAGPDVVGSTVQPHQFLDFLSGRLSTHFVRDRPSLERSIAERDREPDPDGRFRINSLFCHADSWQPALPELVQEGDTVLMDLRNFSAANAGCIHELRFLAREVPFSRCLLVVDDTTDEWFLESTLSETWERLPSSSPNYGRPLDKAVVHRLGSGPTSVQRLVRRLCDGADEKCLSPSP